MRGGSSNGQAHVSQTQPDGEGNPQEQAELNREEVGKLRNLLGTLEKPRAIGTCSLALSSIVLKGVRRT